MVPIDEFNVTGSHDGNTIQGKINAYPDALDKTNEKTGAVIESWVQPARKLEAFPDPKHTKQNVTYKNKSNLKRVATAILAGTVVFVSLSKISKKEFKKVNPPTTQGQVEEENLIVNLSYIVKTGDTLWKIAELYKDPESIQEEVNKIILDNQLKQSDLIFEGDILFLEVPFEKAKNFTYEMEEVKRNHIDRYVTSSFSDTSKFDEYALELSTQVEAALKEAQEARLLLKNMKVHSELYSDIDILQQERVTEAKYAVPLEMAQVVTKTEFNLEDSLREEARLHNEEVVRIR